jgi:hypothetical protein
MICENQLDKNFQPVELGYDRSGNLYDNEFSIELR